MMPYIYIILPIVIIALFLKIFIIKHFFSTLVFLLLLFFIAVIFCKYNLAVFINSANAADYITKQQSYLIDNIPPIWLPGIEDQFEADTYPSKKTAMHALSLRIKNQPDIKFKTINTDKYSAIWSDDSNSILHNGKVEAITSTSDGLKTITANFVEKPWVDNFADFVNQTPEHKWVLAFSQQSCISQAQAEQQAIDDACRKVSDLLNQNDKQRLFKFRNNFNLTSADIRNSFLVADKFAQSFTGSAGKIWRQAILIDASAYKLKQLAKQKIAEQKTYRTRWFSELISVVAIMILICIVYLFLNAATKGYYSLSLRVIAAVLVLVSILSVFTLI